jgi:hypothetical protein
LFRRSSAVDQPKTSRLAARKLMIGSANPLVKFGALLLVAHLMMLSPRVSARQSRFRVDVDAQRQIRDQPVTGDAIHFEDNFPSQAMTRALVGDRRIGEGIRYSLRITIAIEYPISNCPA